MPELPSRQHKEGDEEEEEKDEEDEEEDDEDAAGSTTLPRSAEVGEEDLAFPSLDHHYMWKALEAWGVPQHVINAYQKFYHGLFLVR